MTQQQHLWNRRDWLKANGTLAMGVVAPYVITSSALGQGERAAASDRITLGLIGVGGRGRDLFRGFLAQRDAQVIAVADCYRDRRESMASMCKGAAYQDFRELLAREDLDAVVVATPDHWHVPIALLAARAGKSAYVEKPLGLTIAQDLACRQAFEEARTVFQYGTQQRSLPHCHRACELVRRGVIGQVRKIEVDAPDGGQGGSAVETPVPDGFDYEMWLGPAPLRPYTPDRCRPPGTYWIYDQSIGYLAGWGAHPLDLMVWASDADLSGPIAVEGRGMIPNEGLYDTVHNWDMKLMLGDVELVFRPGADRTKLIGDDGWIQVSRDADRTLASDPAWLQTPINSADCQLLVSTSHEANFLQAIKRNDPQAAVSNLRDAVRSDVLSQLCDIAVRTGERIRWDPGSEKLIDASSKAQAMLERPARDPWA